MAPRVRPRDPHSELYLSGERDRQANHPGLRCGGETLFIPQPGEAEHEEERTADPASGLHARAGGRSDGAGARDAESAGELQGE